MSQSHTFKGVGCNTCIDEIGKLHFTYHNTAIVTLSTNGDITLRTDGWRTPTTKNHMNQIANQHKLGFTVYQKAHEWYIDTSQEKDIPFAEGITFNTKDN
jgi:hypothetical protein